MAFAFISCTAEAEVWAWASLVYIANSGVAMATSKNYVSK